MFLKMDEFKKYEPKKIVLTLLKYSLFLFLLLVLGFVFLIFYYTWNLPQPEKFTETPFIQSTKIYDRTGNVLLYDIYGEEKREIVSFDKISENIKSAVLATEDANFYQHSGISIEGLFRSLLIDLKLQSTSHGGSTITQQLIRTVYLSTQKTISRKIREIVLSIELEQKYSKDQIFEWYLNAIPLGENCYGMEAASQTYFNKSASDVSIAEAAMLTALIQAPSRYSPYGPNKELLLARKDYVIDRMTKVGYITAEQAEIAKEEKINLAESTIPIKAADFVLYVKKYLENKYGEDYLKEKGLRVYTTLDWDLQEYVEDVVKDADQINIQKGAYNTATVVINPKNGEILSLLGSKNWNGKSYPEGCDDDPNQKCLFEPKYDVATMGERQPGSAFKPFVYATAFAKGYTPDTILWDAKTEFNPVCNPSGDDGRTICYHPQNYDGTYRGQVTLRSALSGSLNIPSVKLLYLSGIEDSIKTAKDMGITTLNNTESYGLSLVLGGGEVNLLEMTSAYGIFAAEGNYSSPVAILRIEDVNGKTIEENKKQSRKVLDTQVSRQINSILSDNNARSFIFGYNSELYFDGYQVAAKTGTTQNYNDGWTMGYTPFASVGVWVGNNDNSSTRDKGVGLAAPIWRKIMEKLLSSNIIENFTQPDPITNRSPALLGQLPKDDINTILYYVDRDNPLGQPPTNPETNPQYALWQIGINNWLIQNSKK
jgi:membrane peptidoglycan carboxypeptidase